MDWKKITLILGAIVSIIIIATALFNASGNVAVVKNNANNVPAVERKLDDHITEDKVNNKGLSDAIANLATQVKSLSDAVADNNRIRLYENFDRRKSNK